MPQISYASYAPVACDIVWIEDGFVAGRGDQGDAAVADIDNGAHYYADIAELRSLCVCVGSIKFGHRNRWSIDAGCGRVNGELVHRLNLYCAGRGVASETAPSPMAKSLGKQWGVDFMRWMHIVYEGYGYVYVQHYGCIFKILVSYAG